MSEADPTTTMEVDKRPEIDNINLPDNSEPTTQSPPDNDISTETENSDSPKPSELSVSEDNPAAPDKKYNDSSDQTSSTKSRELKSILALSKEANLKTNISHRRKKDMRDSPRGNSDTESKKPVKMVSESKNSFRFPVTAEAELEELQEDESKDHSEIKVPNEVSKIVKRKRDTSRESTDRTWLEDGGKKNKKIAHGDIKVFKINKDAFCWRCHREGVNVVCETCPRAYHQKCLKQTIMDANHWPCPECVAILRAESTQTRSPAMKGMTLEHLCSLLKFAVNRMMQCQGSEPFLHPVSDAEFPEYKKYIIQPMDLTMLEKNIKENVYGSTQAFEADAKWLLHNSIIFNSYQSKLTSAVKSMIKICKQEMIEIENCPSCYLKANVNKSTWFVEVCPKPHILVWAKLKGFPYWPAKAMSVSSTGMVDVRFFGAHDRAWVHWRDCYLYSEKDPNTFKQKRFDIEKCVEELNVYIDNLKQIYGEFRYAPFREPLDPDNLSKQLRIFLPKYKSVVARRKSHRESSESKPEELNFSNSASPTKEEPADEPEKSESYRSNSNFASPVPDNDTTMEGYGTDDEMQPEIDLESRKAFADKKVTEGEGTEDEEDLDDTQVPSNVSVENALSRGKVRSRGSLNNSIGKFKFMPRLSSDTRPSSEELSTPSPRKASRRNSDQSVKSDSSRVSNISDKINRVNISENMEITLGNEDVGCVSISENISPPNGENSRSGSENSIEIKKKPVQVDINNAEFSISPSKLKISDQLIKRLTDVEKIQAVKKSLGERTDAAEENCEPSTSTPKKKKLIINGDVESLLDRSNRNFNEDVVIENQANIFEMIESSFAKKEPEEKSKYLKTIQPSIREFMTVKQKIPEENEIPDAGVEPSKEMIADQLSSSSKENGLDKNDSTENTNSVGESKKMDADCTENAAVRRKQELSSPKITETTVAATSEEIYTVVEESNDKGKDKTNAAVSKHYQSSSSQKANSEKQIVISEKTAMETATSKLLTNSENKTVSEKSSEQNVLENSSEIAEKEPTVEEAKPCSDPSVQKKLADSGHPPENVPKPSTTVEKELPTLKVIKRTPEKRKSTEKTATSEKSNGKPLNKELVNIIEEFEDKGDADVGRVTFDKKKIFDVIHSSLKSVNKQNISADKVKDGVIKQREVVNKTNEVNRSADKEGHGIKKRKLSSEETSSPAKLVKLVSIESILNKKDNEENVEKEVDKRTLDIIEKEIDKRITEKQSAPVVDPGVMEIAPEDIKSEPESDDEMMEEKRKYLSALNIHEKTAELEKKETNEIRTRSKAEEKRERFKVVDNLTRIIDDVAMNYSAQHEGERLPPRKPERRKSGSSSFPVHEGEIFVKSFARLHNPPPPGKQRARKTFPMPVYVKPPHKNHLFKKDVSLLRRDAQPQKILNSIIGNKNQSASTTSSAPEKPATSTPNPVYSLSRTSSLNSTTMTFSTPTSAGLPPPTSVSMVPTSMSLAPQSSVGLVSQSAMGLVSQSPMGLVSQSPLGMVSQSPTTKVTSASVGLVTPTSLGLLTPTSISLMQTQKSSLDAGMAVPHQTMAMGHVILMPSNAVNYCTPLLNTVTHPTPALAPCPISAQGPQSVLKTIVPTPNLRTSQNYIPHNDDDSSESSSPPSNNNVLTDFLNQQPTTSQITQQRLLETPEPVTPSAATVAETIPTSSANPATTSTPTVPSDSQQEDEFAVLNGLIPESVSRAVSDLLLRPPPRLKPRPPGITSNVFDEGIPSTAGDVTTRINSISHRMTDYFRGMLIETLEDLGRSVNPEAKVVSLQLELEAVRHRHSLEMAEVRKNMCSILKDIQRSIVEERDKIVDETRASCEAETIRRVELAKSKQWCANCPKEAQFYCCWNTSYCDYPCQQKHWPQHAGKCTQSIEKATGTGAVPPNRSSGQPIVLRPAGPPKPGMGRIIAKPAKVYMNRATAAPQKSVKTVPSSGLALVETTPGNYELVSNGSLGLSGKIYTTAGAINSSKFKGTTSSTVGVSPRISTVTSDPMRQAASSGSRPQHIM